MKKLLLTLTIALFLPLTTQAGYVLNETFTTGSRPASWWVGSNGDYGYATSPAPLEGTYSLRADTSGQGLYINGAEEVGEQWGYFMLLFPAMPDSFEYFFTCSDAAFNTVITMILNANGSVTLGGGGAFETTDAGVISANTVYHVFWRAKPGTGSNGQVEMWINTTNDRASTPAGAHEVYNASTITSNIQNHAFQYGIGDTEQFIVDVAQWADTDEFAGGAPAATPYSCSALFCLNAPMFVNAPLAIGKSIPVASAQSSLLTGIISYWKLDESSGSALDAHGSNTATENASGIGTVAGKINGARDVDWVSDGEFTISDNASLSLGSDTDFTICGWFNRRSDTGFPQGLVYKSAYLETSAAEYQLIMDASSHFTLVVGNGSLSASVSSTATISNSTWYFVCAWHDSTANKLYVQVNNGTPDEAAWSGGTQDGTTAFSLCGIEGTAVNMDGYCDEVSFWKRVLTSDERTTLYNGGSGVTYPF
jgi:hypothetical protein